MNEVVKFPSGRLAPVGFEETAAALIACLRSLISDAERSGLSRAALAMELAIDMVEAERRLRALER